jgi:rhomboid protease GluP
MRFAKLVLGRPYIFTIVFLVANFFLFLLMWKSSGLTSDAIWSFPTPVLIAYGAKLNVLINHQPHQWWRFVTPIFLHGSLIHLLVNMYSLWMIGPYVEKLYGSAKFVFFWVVTGVMGVLASYLTVVDPNTPLGPIGRFLFKNQDGPSIGASGALFGLVGVLFVFGIKFRNELPEGFKRAFGTGLLPVIVLNLFIGFMGQRIIDNAAHLGGLVSGAALALVIGYRRPGEPERFQLVWKVIQIACLAFVVVCFAQVAKNFGADFPPEPANVISQPSKNQPALKFSRAMNEAQDAFSAARKGDLSEIDPALKALGETEGPDFKSDQLRRQLVLLLQRAKEPQPVATPSPAKSKPEKANSLDTEFATFHKDYEEWVKTSGKAFFN